MPLSCVQSWNLYKGLVFDQILKANFKINEKLWNNAHKSSKHTQQNCTLFSYVMCEFEQDHYKTFELFTIKSVKKKLTPSICTLPCNIYCNFSQYKNFTKTKVDINISIMNIINTHMDTPLCTHTHTHILVACLCGDPFIFYRLSGAVCVGCLTLKN